MLKATRYHIGTSGWHYDDWRGIFYPEKLPRAGWLEFYTRHFPTLELNNTFYRLPPETAFTRWYASSPPDFVFAVKVSRYITHIKRLKDCTVEVANFISRVTLLKEKLGPLLYQLPPGLHRDDDRLEAFLAVLPRGYKHAVEFRHESWFTDKVFDMLREHGAGLCIFDMPSLTSPILTTSNFAYIRFHGSDSLYSGYYSHDEMADWAKKIAGLARNLASVYIYFNNDVAGYALQNAATLRRYLEKRNSQD
jgi:uncharacterized protein YecE (DUF72 family)